MLLSVVVWNDDDDVNENKVNMSLRMSIRRTPEGEKSRVHTYCMKTWGSGAVRHNYIGHNYIGRKCK